MHAMVRMIIAGIVSSLFGYILMAVGNGVYSFFTGNPVPLNSDFTIINWTISLIGSGVVFIVIYLKVTDWLGE